MLARSTPAPPNQGYGNLASSPDDIADMSHRHIEWVRGRRESLMGFSADGRMVAHLMLGDAATPKERNWIRLALNILASPPMHERRRA